MTYDLLLNDEIRLSYISQTNGFIETEFVQTVWKVNYKHLKALISSPGFMKDN